MLSLYSSDLLVLSLLFNAIAIAVFAIAVRTFPLHPAIGMHSMFEIFVFFLIAWSLFGVAISREFIGVWGREISGLEELFTYSVLSNIIFLYLLGLLGLFLLFRKYGKALADAD